MKYAVVFLMVLAAGVCAHGQILIDHWCADLDQVPATWVKAAKQTLHIAYGHTSHGSQLISGMVGLVGFMNGLGYEQNLFALSEGGASGSLDLDDYFVAGDLGSPDRTTWADMTRNYLNSPGNADVNVVVWAWEGEADTSAENITLYLSLMSQLETDFKDVHFVYMTGHLDGTGLTGNLHLRNQQIRDYCQANDKILYDFEDIESYDPDGAYFGNKNADDGCNYDANADGIPDGNWAIEWQLTHAVGTEWFYCDSAHSQPLNANLKAYAAWWLWARLAGWPGPSGGEGEGEAAEGEGEGEGEADLAAALTQVVQCFRATM